MRIVTVRPHRGRLLVRFEGIDDATAALAFAGATLHAPRANLELHPGEYFDADLVGCAVQGTDGTPYGAVERVEHYPASDMLIVGGRMIPMVGAIVTGIDLAGKTIVIDPPAGLLD